jgi:hypothetical protein
MYEVAPHRSVHGYSPASARPWLHASRRGTGEDGFAANADVGINVNVEPVLRCRPRPARSASAHALEAALLDRMVAPVEGDHLLA